MIALAGIAGDMVIVRDAIGPGDVLSDGRSACGIEPGAAGPSQVTRTVSHAARVWMLHLLAGYYIADQFLQDRYP
jgi:hypothetical protein